MPSKFVSRAHDAVLNEINQFFVQQENETLDHITLYEKLLIHFKRVDSVNSTDPKVYAAQMANAIDELDIDISISNWIRFLADVSAIVEDQSKPYEIENGMKIIAQNLNESATWYHFLIKFHDILSEYKMQSIPAKNTAMQIVSEIRLANENYMKNVNELGLKHLLDETSKKLYAEIENMTVNQMKLNALKNLLQQAMTFDLITLCSPRELIVKGYNVKVYDVINRKCSAPIKSIKIFAMNRLYIDTNIDETGSELQLSMIAPAWEIIGAKKIILDGATGAAHPNSSARNGVEHSENGLNGLPGKAGGPAGHFFGIGNKFLPLVTSTMNGELDIHLHGGTGGPGQNGGNGNAI